MHGGMQMRHVDPTTPGRSTHDYSRAANGLPYGQRGSKSHHRKTGCDRADETLRYVDAILPRAHHPTKNHHAMDPNDRHDSGHLHQVFGQNDLSEIPGPADDRGVETTSASFILCL